MRGDTAGHSIEYMNRRFQHGAGVHFFGAKWMLSDGVPLRYPVLPTCATFPTAGEGYHGAYNGAHNGGSLIDGRRLLCGVQSMCTYQLRHLLR